MKPYTRQWVEHNFGNPARFPQGSRINAEIRHQSMIMPEGAKPIMKEEGCLSVVIPSTRTHNASTYNWFTQAGIEAIKSAIENMFDLDFKNHVIDSMVNGVQRKAAIHAYCHRNGIKIDHEETLSQRINKLIMKYKKKGIKIHEDYEEKLIDAFVKKKKLNN